MLGCWIQADWATTVCGEVQGGPIDLEFSLRPNVKSGADVERIGTDAWERWRAAWRRLELPSEAGPDAWIEHDDERDAYAMVATAGKAGLRRIEQEKLPPEEAVAALMSCRPSG